MKMQMSPPSHISATASSPKVRRLAPNVSPLQGAGKCGRVSSGHFSAAQLHRDLFLLFYRKGHLASLMIRPTVARKEQLTVISNKNIRECFISE